MDFGVWASPQRQSFKSQAETSNRQRFWQTRNTADTILHKGPDTEVRIGEHDAEVE